jgi:hypothetical protein
MGGTSGDVLDIYYDAYSDEQNFEASDSQGPENGVAEATPPYEPPANSSSLTVNSTFVSTSASDWLFARISEDSLPLFTAPHLAVQRSTVVVREIRPADEWEPRLPILCGFQSPIDEFAVRRPSPEPSSADDAATDYLEGCACFNGALKTPRRNH